MPSPFPGMNPYLEQNTVWSDFHESFIPFARDVLKAQLGSEYVVKIDEHLFIHELPAEERRLIGRTDVGVAQPPWSGTPANNAAVLDAPSRVSLPAVDMEQLSFLEIRDRVNWRLITVLELLSPTNKHSGPDREQYLVKRRQLLRSQVHFVEIDLLRGGPRMPMADATPSDFCALVSRFEERPEAGFWPIKLRDPLPVIPIPLEKPGQSIQLDLQALLHRVYDSAGYHDWIYTGQPQPPLRPDDATWASQFVPMS